MKRQYKNLSEYVNTIVKESKTARKKVITSGFDILDKIIGSFRPGELVVIASRPSVGKTALALSMAVNMAFGEESIPIGYFTMEMDGISLMNRVVANVGRMNLMDLRKDSKDDSLIKQIADVSEMMFAESDNMYICDESSLQFSDIYLQAIQMVYEKGVKAIFIDYLGIIGYGWNDSVCMPRHEWISLAAKELKQLARELDIPIICLCQINREGGRERPPMLADLRDAGTLEHEADIILLLDDPSSRIESYGIEKKEVVCHDNESEGKIRTISVAKHRNGITGTINLRFFPEYARFENNHL